MYKVFEWVVGAISCCPVRAFSVINFEQMKMIWRFLLMCELVNDDLMKIVIGNCCVISYKKLGLKHLLSDLIRTILKVS